MSTRTEYPNFVGNTGKFLKVNATETDVLWDEVDASDITGVLGIDHGGTGANNAPDALNNLLPDQTGHTSEVLHTDGTDPYWAPDTGGGVQSVTGLNTDNADPLNPVVQISVDGVTVTGDGTPGNPLTSTGGSGADTRIYDIPATVTVNTTLRSVFIGLLGGGDTGVTEPIASSPFYENVVVKRIDFYVGSNTVNEDTTVILRKNGVDTSFSQIIPATTTGQFSFTCNEAFNSTDLFTIHAFISLTATGAIGFKTSGSQGSNAFNVMVQVSGGSPLGVQSVIGNGVDNTDPFNPVVQTASSTTEGTLSAADWNTFNNNVNSYDSSSIYSTGGFTAPYGVTTDVVFTNDSYVSTLTSGTPAIGIFTLLKNCNTLKGSFMATVTKNDADNTIATNGVFRVYVNGVTVPTVADVSWTDLVDTTDKQRSSPMFKSFILKNLVIGDTIQIKLVSTTGTGGSGYNVATCGLLLEKLI